MTPSRTSRRALLLCLGLAMPFVAVSARAGDRKDVDAILVQGDPAAATAFLRDDDAQARLKADDAELYGLVFARAAELQDIADLIQGIPRPSTYRQGLLIRTGCVFCQSPRRLLKWTDEALPALDAERKTALRKAVLEWDSFDSERRDWLAARGHDASEWTGADLKTRVDALQPWVDAQAEALKGAFPTDAASLAALRERLTSLDDVLANSLDTSLWKRLDSAESAIHGLEDVRRRVIAGNDPRLSGLLAKAENAGDLETRLALLSRIYDGLGLANDSVNAAAPPREGQIFDDGSRETVAQLLRTGLMKEIAGTYAGDRLAELYKESPLDLRVGPSKDENVVGWYQPGGAITINEEYIQRFLKVRGRDIRDLQRDSGLLRALNVELSPLFVHESTHKRQYQWAVDSRLSGELGAQNLEVEAMETEALFVIEKSMKDPSYLAVMMKDGESPGLASGALALARHLAKGGSAYFRDHIDGLYYPDSISLEGDAWQSVKKNGRAGNIPTDYAAYRARQDWESNIVDDRLGKLLDAGAAAKIRARTEVPAPSR